MTARLPGSFRDPSGQLFRHEDRIYRRVNDVYRAHYDLMMASGFYEAVVGDASLISHEEVEPSSIPEHKDAYRILLPEQIPFISYPYEWSFSQLKDAALLTLSLQARALEFDLSLKDASAYNVQFHKGRPVFIDTLSFEKYPEGRPWVAYQQFCMHFLAPLALVAYRHPEFLKLLRTSLDGIPLDLASRVLPARSRLKPGLLAHIHLHARSQRVHADSAASAERTKSSRVSKLGLRGIVESLEAAVRKLSWKPAGTEWGDYYDETNYSSEAQAHKYELISGLIDQLRPETVWDLGANTGHFSRIAADRGIFTLAADLDPAAVEKNYLDSRSLGNTSLLPLVIDLMNPTPSLGWGGDERMSLAARGPAHVVLALALVHHLAITNNVPLLRIAEYFSSLCRVLIIEFVPKTDSQVVRLLRSREDIFPDYTIEGFETAFAECFRLRERMPIHDSERTLFCLERR